MSFWTRPRPLAAHWRPHFRLCAIGLRGRRAEPGGGGSRRAVPAGPLGPARWVTLAGLGPSSSWTASTQSTCSSRSERSGRRACPGLESCPRRFRDCPPVVLGPLQDLVEMPMPEPHAVLRNCFSGTPNFCQPPELTLLLTQVGEALPHTLPSRAHQAGTGVQKL